MRTINVGGVVRSIEWCPNKALSLVAVAADRKLLLINPGVGDILVVKKTDSLFKETLEQTFAGSIFSRFIDFSSLKKKKSCVNECLISTVSEKVKAVVQWENTSEEEWDTGIRFIVNHFKEIKQVGFFNYLKNSLISDSIMFSICPYFTRVSLFL